MQAPDATRVGGYNTWKSVGRQVSKGEKGIAILAPVVRKVDVDATAQDTSTQTEERRRIVAFTQAYVFDISQTQGSLCPSRHNPRSYRAKRRKGCGTSWRIRSATPAARSWECSPPPATDEAGVGGIGVGLLRCRPC
jgi:N-terminal domain of anti-restriction factor ArdC